MKWPGKNRNSQQGRSANQPRPAFVPPPGLITTPQCVLRSAPFTFVEDKKPAISLSKEVRSDVKHISLVKSFDAMEQALKDAGLAGLRCEIIVMVDDSGSIMNQWKAILKILVLYLGAGLNLSISGKITVLPYGLSADKDPIVIDRSNYLDIANLVVPTWGGTPMGATLERALKISEKNNCLTIIANLTDGNPTELVAGESWGYDSNDPDAHIPGTIPMSNQTIISSGHPVVIKNLAVKKVPFLVKIDDLPSQIEIKKEADADGELQPIRVENNDLVLYKNPVGIRRLDNVDSQEISDPFTITPPEFAVIFAEELMDTIEVMGHAGVLTGVPGHPQTFF